MSQTAHSTIVVMSGLPGSGKSTVAEGIASNLAFSILSVDPIEAAMWRSGISQDATGIAAYSVAATLAEENLRLGNSVIIDAVNPVEEARKPWRDIALRCKAAISVIHCKCDNVSTHRHRIESRVRGIPGMPEVTWERVLEREAEFEAWVDAHLSLDTSEAEPEEQIRRGIDYVNMIANAG